METLDVSYTFVLRNHSFGIEKVFDAVLKPSFSREINNVGTFTFSLDGNDTRIPFFRLDNLIEIRRGILKAGIQKYTEMTGLVRKTNFVVSEEGKSIFEISGVGLNHFLERTIINYPAATIKSYKIDPAETVMKAYAEENCGASALVETPYERDSDGVLPFFTVEASTGAGIEWEGDRAYTNLLETLQDIANYSRIDFDVTWDRQNKLFVFKTFPNGFGVDRTIIGLNRETGLNSSGNVPVVFSLARGNIREISHMVDRLSETNVVTVLGDGDGATRDIKVREKNTRYDSPWNRCESSRAKSGFESEMEIAGDEYLEELAYKDDLSFKPLPQTSTMYGRDFSLGDKISIYFNGTIYNRRIVKIDCSVEDKENISFEFKQF